MKFYNIFFSPTGGTKKVANIVAKGTKLDAEEIDLIKEPDKLMKVNFEKEDLCLVAVPSYGGRIPSTVTDMFCNVKAEHIRYSRRQFLWRCLETVRLMILYWSYRMFWKHRALCVSQAWRLLQNIL